MGWDGVEMTDDQGRRRPVPDVLSAQFAGNDQTVVAIDASVAKGRAYLAVRTGDGEVRPLYLLLDPVDESDPEHPMLEYKVYPVDESPQRWPRKIAEVLTTWES